MKYDMALKKVKNTKELTPRDTKELFNIVKRACKTNKKDGISWVYPVRLNMSGGEVLYGYITGEASEKLNGYYVDGSPIGRFIVSELNSLESSGVAEYDYKGIKIVIKIGGFNE